MLVPNKKKKRSPSEENRKYKPKTECLFKQKSASNSLKTKNKNN